MNKLTKQAYTLLIAKSLRSVYGNTLHEYDTDLKMAKKVVEDLNEFLYFREGKMSKEVFNQLRYQELNNGDN